MPRVKTSHLCHAECVLPSGETLRSIASSLSVGGALIVCMNPPPIGTRLLVSLCRREGSVVSLIGARVVGHRLDPADANHSGFEVLFPMLDDGQLAALEALIADLRPSKPPVIGHFARGRDEARMYPRVAVRLMAQVRSDGAVFTASVKNVSMSGALLVVDDPHGAAPVMLAVGAKIGLTLISGSDDETVELEAEVARHASPPEPTGVGVRFTDLTRGQRRGLESLIVYAIILDHFPTG